MLETYVVLHRTLFRDREAAATLEATAPHTSRALGALVSDGIFLAVHRLVDVGARRGQRSASIETLLAHLPPDAAPLRRELKKTLTGLRAECRGVAERTPPFDRAPRLRRGAGARARAGARRRPTHFGRRRRLRADPDGDLGAVRLQLGVRPWRSPPRRRATARTPPIRATIRKCPPVRRGSARRRARRVTDDRHEYECAPAHAPIDIAALAPLQACFRVPHFVLVRRAAPCRTLSIYADQCAEHMPHKGDHNCLGLRELPPFALRVRNAEVGSSSLLPSTTFLLRRIFSSAHILPIGQGERLERVDLPRVRRVRALEHPDRLMARQRHDGEVAEPIAMTSNTPRLPRPCGDLALGLEKAEALARLPVGDIIPSRFRILSPSEIRRQV